MFSGICSKGNDGRPLKKTPLKKYMLVKIKVFRIDPNDGIIK